MCSSVFLPVQVCPPLRPSSPTPLRSSSQKKLSTSTRRRKSWLARTRTPASPLCCTAARPEKTRKPFWLVWTQQTQTTPLSSEVPEITGHTLPKLWAPSTFAQPANVFTSTPDSNGLLLFSFPLCSMYHKKMLVFQGFALVHLPQIRKDLSSWAD